MRPIRNVLLHELGHAIGMAHSTLCAGPTLASMMYPDVNRGMSHPVRADMGFMASTFGGLFLEPDPPGISGAFWVTGLNVAYLDDYDAVEGYQHLYTNTSWDLGSTWQGEQQIPGLNPTANDGVSATYDPESGEDIYVWRGQDGYEFNLPLNVNKIEYEVGEAGNWHTLADAYGNPYIAADTPAIACGDVYEVGAYNCLLVWVDGSDWQRPMRWTQFYVDANGEWVTTFIRTLSYFTSGSPAVAYDEDSTYPWLLAFNSDGRATYTLRKTGTGIAFSYMREHDVPGIYRAAMPAIGATPAGYVLLTGNE